jgi:CubicO group peptidase (beta-lactamase class C family)
MLKRSSAYFVSLVLLSVSLSFGQAAAARQKPQTDFRELERVALEELKETNTPGAAIAVISGDRVIFAKGLGVANTETNAPVTPEMLFRLGSTTKMFTSAALVGLAEQGKLKLDDPIGNYIRDLHPKLAQVTSHQLLSHTAGIIDQAPMYGRHDDSAMGDEVRSWKEDKLFTEPGRIISYSNPGYWLAGFVIERVGGKPFADYMSESLFKPLGMNSTTFRPTMAMTYPMSQGHNPVRGGTPTVIRPFADNSASWPAGSIFSNVLDLSRFVIAFLNDGRLDGRQVISPAVIKKMSVGHAAVPTGGGSKYGYGLMSMDYRGVRLLEHGGSRSGFGSTIRMAPDQRFAVIVLANRSGAALNKTAEKAIELMLPLKPEEKQAEKKELPMSGSEMAAYVGAYRQGETRLEIFMKDGKLYGRQGQNEGLITKTGESMFSIAMPNGPSSFAIVRGADGKGEYISLGLRSLRRAEAGR